MIPLLLITIMAIAACLGSLGQVSLKYASGTPLTFTGIVLNPYLWAFAVCYGIGTIINFYAYRMGGTVAVIYPVVALSYVFAALLAWKLLGETPNAIVVAGICVIIVGVALIGIGANA